MGGVVTGGGDGSGRQKQTTGIGDNNNNPYIVMLLKYNSASLFSSQMVT